VDWWNLGPVALMINSLISLSGYMGGSFGLAIIVLTIIVRSCLLPLTMKQLKSSRAMQGLQPRLAELQKKYAKDKQKLAEEQMRLYKESGVSPAGCAVPMIIQFPIWIALYQSIIKALGITPEELLGLSRYLWSWPILYSTLPLDNSFLWLNLVFPDWRIAILVGVTMWLSQKMVTPSVSDPQQKAQSQMMLWMMPLLFGFIATSLPSGLALYWVVSNLFSMAVQYVVIGGWGGLSRGGAHQAGGRELKRRIIQAESATTETSATQADIVDSSATPKEGVDEGEYGVKRQLRGGGHQASLRSIRRDSGRGKGHRSK
jgi:YidC/Oxa1 family membrane protein insertase